MNNVERTWFAQWLRMVIDNNEKMYRHFQYVERELAQWESQVDADVQMSREVDAWIASEIGKELPSDTLALTAINGLLGEVSWRQFREGLIDEEGS